MVVAANDAVADWCRSSIDLGPGGILSPLVIGPAAVPVVDDAALAAALHLSDDRAVLYSDLIYAALSEAAKAALEELMAAGTYQFQSDFAKKHQALGRTEGRTEGRAEGLAEGRAQALLDVLEERGLPVSDVARARILACTDTAQLSTWLPQSRDRDKRR